MGADTLKHNEWVKVGDIFTIANPDKPSWCEGKFRVTKVSEDRIDVERVKYG